MNNASRIIEAQRERESSLAGGEAARGQGAFERGNGREVQTVNTTRPRFCPPPPLRPVHRAPELRLLSGTLCSLAGLAVGGGVLGVGECRCAQLEAQLHRSPRRWFPRRRTAEGNSCGPAASGPVYPDPHREPSASILRGLFAETPHKVTTVGRIRASKGAHMPE